MEKWFADKAALVTGGGDGIGRAGAILFAQRGAKVVVTDIDRSAAETTVQMIVEQGGEAVAVAGDVTDSATVKAFVQEVVDRYGHLDCAFNNAGIIHPKDAEWDDAAFRRTIEVNLHGTMTCLRYEIEAMLKTGGGTIVNTSSINAFVASAAVPSPGYTASKHALIGLTKTAALQYARQNIRVNALCPGVTYTAIVRDVMEFSPEARATLENFAPMGRMAQPEEMAEAAIWLASDKSSFVTAHALVVDGGFLAQ